jgi:hypothetical protein
LETTDVAFDEVVDVDHIEVTEVIEAIDDVGEVSIA